jgi:hypothetical protein
MIDLDWSGSQMGIESNQLGTRPRRSDRRSRRRRDGPAVDDTESCEVAIVASAQTGNFDNSSPAYVTARAPVMPRERPQSTYREKHAKVLRSLRGRSSRLGGCRVGGTHVRRRAG